MSALDCSLKQPIGSALGSAAARARRSQLGIRSSSLLGSRRAATAMC
jgi:hypothetical protein